jgi:dihydroorotate dehydrogenase electron transfer subunit
LSEVVSAIKQKVRILGKETDGRYCLLKLECPEVAASALPGQFVSLMSHSSTTPGNFRLRRPLSIHLWVDKNLEAAGSASEAIGLAIYFKIIGQGTRALAALGVGDCLELLGPLGHGRPPQESDPKRVWCVGGGYGVAPMIFWAQALANASVEKRLIYGIRHPEDLPRFSAFPDGYFQGVSMSLGMDFQLASMESAEGIFQGTSIDLLQRQLENADIDKIWDNEQIVACGPMGMLGACHQLAQRYGIRCRVMLEEFMGCGMGVCRSCVCPGHGEDGSSRNITLCLEGPLVDSDRVDWDRIGK